MSDEYREMHTSLILYKILIYLTIKYINIRFHTSFPNLIGMQIGLSQSITRVIFL
jgi:hypothetical protein